MSAIIIPRRAKPSWATGFARSQSDARFPGLWDGLQAHYAPPLGATGGTLFDVSGRKNNGVITGATWDATGALSFDGSNDYVEFGDVVDAMTDDLSVAFWIKSTQSSGMRVIQKRGTGAAGTQSGWQVSHGVDIEGDIGWSNTLFDDGSNYVRINSDDSFGLLDGEWRHCVIQWDVANQIIQLWADGVAQNPPLVNSGTVVTINTARSLTLGAAWNNASTQSQFFQGLLRLATVYNRLISTSEIQLLHTRGLAGYNAILERKSRVFPVTTAAPPTGLDIPVAMHHYTKNTTAA